jgi:hypothetical protein
MAKAKQGFKRKRSKTALPVWAAAGVSLAMMGGASANAPARTRRLSSESCPGGSHDHHHKAAHEPKGGETA